ncbi:MAG TPA: hypothetical protein P5539_15490 [Mesotoga sp.]|mgnify:CR=1 FL=1|nr:hypothetical protein [Mesotoga sp.]
MPKTFSSKEGSVLFAASGDTPVVPTGFNFQQSEGPDKTVEVGKHMDTGSGGGTSVYSGNYSASYKITYGSSTPYPFFAEGEFYDIVQRYDADTANKETFTALCTKITGRGIKIVKGENMLVFTAEFEVDGAITPAGTVATAPT